MLITIQSLKTQVILDSSFSQPAYLANYQNPPDSTSDSFFLLPLSLPPSLLPSLPPSLLLSPSSSLPPSLLASLPPSLPSFLPSYLPTSIYSYYVAGTVLKTENTAMNETTTTTTNPCPHSVYVFVKEDRGKEAKYIVCYMVVSATEKNNADKRDNAYSHVYIYWEKFDVYFN